MTYTTGDDEGVILFALLWRIEYENRYVTRPLDCLTQLSFNLLILYNALVMLSLPSFPFIVSFL